MSEERVRASISRITAQVISDKELSNLEGNTWTQEPVRPGRMDFPAIVTKPPQRGHVGAPDGDYMQLVAFDNLGTYPESLTKEHQTKMVLTLFLSAPGRCQTKERQLHQFRWIEHRK